METSSLLTVSLNCPPSRVSPFKMVIPLMVYPWCGPYSIWQTSINCCCVMKATSSVQHGLTYCHPIMALCHSDCPTQILYMILTIMMILQSCSCINSWTSIPSITCSLSFAPTSLPRYTTTQNSFVMIYSFSLSKCLLSYLWHLSYLIHRIHDSTESWHHDTITVVHLVHVLTSFWHGALIIRTLTLVYKYCSSSCIFPSFELKLIYTETHSLSLSTKDLVQNLLSSRDPMVTVRTWYSCCLLLIGVWV